MEAIKLNVNQLGEWAPKLHAGDRVLLSGTVYTSRDAAHKRYFGLLVKESPFLLISRVQQFIMLALPERRLILQLEPVDQLRRDGWIHMHRVCWTWD